LYSYRKIIDVRDQDEVTINLPYLLRQDYLRTLTTGTNTDYASGTVSILVLNELRAPDTCAQKMDMIISYSGGPDFELQSPGHTMFEPVMLQSNDMVHYFPNARVTKDLKPAERCISESITSLKQLISKSSPITTNFPVNVTGSFVAIDPYIVGTCYINNARTGYYRGTLDAFSYIGLLYAYQSGGVNIHVRSLNSSNAYTAANEPGLLTSLYNAEGFVAPSAVGFVVQPATFTAGTNVSVCDLSHGMMAQVTTNVATKFTKWLPVGTTIVASPEVFNGAGAGTVCMYHVPYMAQYPNSFVVPTEADSITAAVDSSVPPYANDVFPYPVSSILIQYASTFGTPINLMYARSAGDDFRFKFYTGTPYLTFGQAITSP